MKFTSIFQILFLNLNLQYDFSYCKSLEPFFEPLNSSANVCSNENDDLGSCMSRRDCRSSKGLSIGACSDISQICCYKLPCEETQNRENSVIPGLTLQPIFNISSNSCGTKKLNLRDEQIIGGRSLTETELHPWVLALWHYNSTFNASFPICGAALITTRHALTAAHCVFHGKKENYFVLGGSLLNVLPSRLSKHGGNLMEISEILLHPSFDTIKLENDIALLTLKDDIQFRSELLPICLPSPSQSFSIIHDFAIIVGWGCMDEKCDSKQIPSLLREVIVPIIPNDVAMCWFLKNNLSAGSEEYIPSKLFLVGGDESGTRSTCRGDSGSPVTYFNEESNRFEIIGIVSWSKGCGRPYRPSVWTRVQNYVNWILFHL